MLRLGAERDEVRVVDDQRGCPTYVAHLAEATGELLHHPGGVWHLAADGDCTWLEFAEAIFEEAGLECRVVPITTAELGAPAPRPAYSVLRSEHAGTPRSRTGARGCGIASGLPASIRSCGSSSPAAAASSAATSSAASRRRARTSSCSTR